MYCRIIDWQRTLEIRCHSSFSTKFVWPILHQIRVVAPEFTFVSVIKLQLCAAQLSTVSWGNQRLRVGNNAKHGHFQPLAADSFDQRNRGSIHSMLIRAIIARSPALHRSISSLRATCMCNLCIRTTTPPRLVCMLLRRLVSTVSFEKAPGQVALWN